MATRQEIQIAQDLIKFINIINDLLDCSVDMIRNNSDVGQMKNVLERTCQNIYGYKNKIIKFLDVPGKKQLAVNGLIAWGVNLDNTKQELLNMLTVTNHMNVELKKITSLEELKILANYIETNVPELPLVRKAK